MRRMVLMGGFAFLVACDRPDPAKVNGEDPKPPRPLAEVENILAGEKPPEEGGPADPLPTDPVVPAVPVAKPVPDKPGFVISPYNGKWIDVTGVAPGELMLDPHFPADDKKYFRVPEPQKPKPPPEEEPAATADESSAGDEPE